MYSHVGGLGRRHRGIGQRRGALGPRRRHGSGSWGDDWPGPQYDELTDPPGSPPELHFGLGPLDQVRRFVSAQLGDDVDLRQLVDLL